MDNWLHGRVGFGLHGVMKRGSWGLDQERLRQESRHGAITVARLGDLGVPARTAYRRCAVNGPWQRPLPGVVLLDTARPSERQLVEAALLYAGQDAQLTGVTACRHHGLRRVPEGGNVHLLIPATRKAASTDYVTVERTVRLPAPVISDGLPLAPIVRAVLDACRRIKQPDAVSALITEAVQRKGVPPWALTRELERGSSRGSSLVREVLEKITRGARSVAEIDAMAVWQRSGLPDPLWNKDLFDRDGRFLARPDAWSPEVCLAWEIDSFEFHFSRADYRTTLERNARYAAAGIAVLQTLPSRLREEPDLVATELRAAYQAARAAKP